MIDLQVKGLNVLLVGEGNFSFTVALLEKFVTDSERSSTSACSNVISTCYQKYKELSTLAKKNAHLANKLGSDVWFSIDATALHKHERFLEQTFNHIIFNYPHVGGKMKIHLNRQLLKAFFISASQLLSKGGKVHVTLAKGQSGTLYDVVQRSPADSWQIITMATYGDLVLKEAHPFNAEDFPDYYCNGYRSLEKAFHLQGAWTFIFAKAAPTIKYSIAPTTCINPEVLAYLHCPFVESQLTEAKDIVCEEIDLFAQFFSKEGETCLNVNRKHVETVCLCNEFDDWRTSVFLKHANCNLSALILCRKCCESIESVQRMVLINVPFTVKSIQSLLHFFSLGCKKIEVKHTLPIDDYITSDGNFLASVMSRENNALLAIDTKVFFQLKFNFPPFRPGGLLFPIPRDNEFEMTSLYPPSFCHHLSFWIPSSFNSSHFACCLRYAAGKLVKNFRLIDSFTCEITGRKSLCYAIEYQSLDSALNSEKAFDLQINVIGPFLERCLGVIIK